MGAEQVRLTDTNESNRCNAETLEHGPSRTKQWADKPMRHERIMGSVLQNEQTKNATETEMAPEELATHLTLTSAPVRGEQSDEMAGVSNTLT